ncbi:MAG: tRNA 2-thiouridine(34) synthase MnmA [Tannerellaceae bacterium]|nr:tRNA 2-thiouridine(34) synthase MnmA [Tannerellaceae bacterium]
MEVAALVSGGVDSSVAVHLLKEAGLEPVIFYIHIGMEDVADGGCPSEEDIEIGTYLAHRYGCRFEVVSLHKEYWEKVVDYTLSSVRQGLTPNPDVLCNRYIKFGCFNEQWGKDFAYIATGHYATTTVYDRLTWLSTAKDPVKDQTDFLAQITLPQLSKLLFPIGHLLKSEVRALAASLNLPSAHRPDSQGICFLGKINYNQFIERHLGIKQGAIIEWGSGKRLGTHNGYWFHTIGQRKGLGLSGGPWFVVHKDIPDNTLYVSNGYDPEEQYGNAFLLQDFHFITANPWGNSTAPQDITFKIRHTPEFTVGKLSPQGDYFRIHSDQRLQGIAPGQYGVVYDSASRLCIGSGTIVPDPKKDTTFG